jgi:hypothetical protein
MLLAPGAPAWRIALPEPSDAERALLKARNASTPAAGAKASALKGPLALAFPRSVPAGSEAIALDQLNWQALADGRHAAKIEVASPGAAALRIALKLAATDPGVSLRFSGNDPHSQVFGPIPGNAVAGDTTRFGMFWSPVLEGDVATVEIDVESGTSTPAAILTIAGISHQVVAPASLRGMTNKDVSDIGFAGACNIDVACVMPQSTAATTRCTVGVPSAATESSATSAHQLPKENTTAMPR